MSLGKGGGGGGEPPQTRDQTKDQQEKENTVKKKASWIRNKHRGRQQPDHTRNKNLKTTTIDDGDKRIKLAAKSTILCKQHRQHRRDCHQPAFTALTFTQSDSIRKKCGGGQTNKKKKLSKNNIGR